MTVLRLSAEQRAALELVASDPQGTLTLSRRVPCTKERRSLTGPHTLPRWPQRPAPAGTSAERLKATSLALVAARQSFDKLTTEISKLQAQDIPDV